MKVSQKRGIVIKKSLSVKAVSYTKAVEWIAWEGSETLKHQQSAEANPKDGYIIVRLPMQWQTTFSA